MHNREDETIALDAKCPDTVEMFADSNADTLGDILGRALQASVRADKSIADDFPKQIDQREGGQ